LAAALLATAVFFVLNILIFRTLIGHHVITHPPTVGMEPTALGGIETWISSLLLYIPALFLMEEVAFRGAIDSHVYHPGESQGVESSTIYAIVSAIMVSVLWGLWHVPIIPLPPEFAHASVIVHVALVAPLEVIVGPFLSLFWRRSGNLMVPGFAHATMDSVRNALGGTP
jgi:membrane protease YdiL (CAAX protease family)